MSPSISAAMDATSTSATSQVGGSLPRRSGRCSVLAPVGCGCAIAGAAAYVAVIDPTGAGVHLPACPFHATTGLWCPGCGMTRATHALLRGDLGAAFGFNLLFPLFIAAIVVGWTAWLRSALGRPPRISLSRMPVWMPIALGATLLAFGIIRNLPGFQSLRP